ncbi:hypothetical protein C8J57DRAFT_571395 [Mycena rebaudengoi]|nr:hypothetical protein C8J57DRAFT_571395 [Mycena rebaudengoi]
MITDANISHAAPRSNMSRPLKRGRACMNCRFLKIKCDGQKPMCGPCRKHPKDDDCEYSDGPARSRTKALEDTVSRLEARLHELEHPEASTPSVMLHDPYASTSLPQLTISPPHPTLRSLPNSPYHPQPQLLSPSNSPPESLSSPLSPFSPHSPTGGSPPYQSRSHPGPSPLGIFGTRTTSPSPSEPNVEEIQTLLDSFLANASEFGFFMHERRFYESALLLDSSKRPTPALLQAAYTCGAHFLHLDHEGRFLEKALQCAATDLAASRPHPQAFLHTIQAEVLISHYFFLVGRFIEARAHAGTAVALALGGGLHQIRSLHYHDIPILALSEDGGVRHLHPPADAIEEGERINAFWVVFMLHRNLAVALDPAARVCGVFDTASMQIDTPWPLDMEGYKQGRLSADVHGDSTVRNFLNQPVAPSSTSLMELNVKACILLHRAVYMNAEWKSTVPSRDAQSMTTAFQVTDQLINTLRAQLPNVAQLSSRGSARTILLTRSLLNAATIKLHSIFMYSDPTSRQNCVAAARDMFHFGELNLHGLTCLHPIMGTLWMTACYVLADELKRLRSLQNTWPTDAAADDEKEIYSYFQGGIAALRIFERDSVLMNHQLTKAQGALG